MSSDLVRFSVAMPALLLDEFDRYTAQRGLLVNRSEAIRNLIRDALVNEELEDPAAPVVGSITLVYDLRVPELISTIASVESNYPDEVVSSTHVHLEQGGCMETIAVRGLGYKVKELSDCLAGIKGVSHCKLTVVATLSRIGG